MRRIATATSLMALALTACTTTPCERAARLASATSAAPVAAPQGVTDEDAMVADLLSRMSVERKVAQLIQPQINSFTPEDMERYRFGSYLNGGNGGPYGDEFAPASEWLRYADEMYDASVRPTAGDEPVIPTMWGTDAVHGHTNVIGATIFPHNIGLGATRDTDLVRRIGAATAVEIEATGIDWNFSPTVAVARDDRWGRSYESYSEDPAVVARMGAALVEGLQGRIGDGERLGRGHVIATAKHFFGDGGTDQGVDQGDVNMELGALKSVHAVPYPAAIAAGVETIMASFNSVNGRKMHGNKPLLDDYLRGELGFDGVVVGDWNGHGQVAGCTVTDCPQSLLAGLDIYMVPDDWKGLMDNLVAQVNDGTVPMARLDEAAGRVLRMKLRAGILGPDAQRPSERANAGDYAKVGGAAHRALAREAVAKSQVVLKNDNLLPLRPGSNVLVAGSAADSIAQAAGGWTLTWQGGTELDNATYFPGATSIWAGLSEMANAGGGSATLSADGSYAERPDVAVVVFGEEPYAEFAGDRKNKVFADEEGLELLRRYRSDGIPAVAVFLSGRPLWMNREMNASDAFVASWLPGGEGAGVADVLYGRMPATGRLSFSWPSTCDGSPVNAGDSNILFPVGYGLSLDAPSAGGMLDEGCALLEAASSAWFTNGKLEDGVSATAGAVALPNLIGSANGIVVRGVDRDRQEDAREIVFAPDSRLSLSQSGQGGGAYRIAYEVETPPAGPVMLMVGGTEIDIRERLALSAGKGWREMIITDECAPGLGDTLTLRSVAPFRMKISAIARQEVPPETDCSF
ncbi:glycoside hydrolase family 3 N-terminal domain-containing protein [Sphingomicrobium sp. XHP0235]|uniref:glycoside hydrolase family 3 protein n=1 Tax=Sphingomicrobium aquimarinum TaxID=3133971 RepID=UPI0031FF32CB